MSASEDPEVTRQTRLCVRLIKIVTVLWLPVIFLVLSGSYTVSVPLETSPAIMRSLTICLVLCLVLSLAVFLVGELTGNVSSVDRLWSVLPCLYTALVWIRHPSGRLAVMTLVTVVWSVRLTWNFSRRGGYSWPPWTGCEDYRWRYVRQWPGLNTGLGWTVFNLTFISLYQNFLLLSLAFPALYCARSSAPVNSLDLLVALTFLVLVLVETVADNQQEEFQNEKYRQLGGSKKSAEFPYSVGFITWGLFSVCRHPNYLAEQLLWLVFYLHTIAATGELLNITLAGPVLLVLLFQGSTLLSESITGGKYPKYSQYCEVVPKFIGNFWATRESGYSCVIKE